MWLQSCAFSSLKKYKGKKKKNQNKRNIKLRKIDKSKEKCWCTPKHCYNENIVQVYLCILQILQSSFLIIWININNKTNNVTVEERNKINVLMVYKIFPEQEV